MHAQLFLPFLALGGMVAARPNASPAYKLCQTGKFIVLLRSIQAQVLANDNMQYPRRSLLFRRRARLRYGGRRRGSAPCRSEMQRCAREVRR
jgi:hypothetical protein